MQIAPGCYVALRGHRWIVAKQQVFCEMTVRHNPVEPIVGSKRREFIDGTNEFTLRIRAMNDGDLLGAAIYAGDWKQM